MGDSQKSVANRVAALFRGLPEGSLRVLQITDTHLYADRSGTLLGLDTQQALDQVLALCRACGDVDLVLVTGDLVHDASATGYQRLAELLRAFEQPVFCLPGNHDDPQLMRQLYRQPPLQYVDAHQAGDWLLLFLDSTIPGEEGGRIGEAQLQRLQTLLAAHREQHTLLCLHHHPVPVGSRWMDTMALQDSDAFFEVVDANPQVQGILWGHIHQEFDRERVGVRLLGSPSTCIQFTPQKDDFGVIADPPGCRWLALLPNGQIITEVTRLETMPAGLDTASGGY